MIKTVGSKMALVTGASKGHWRRKSRPSSLGRGSQLQRELCGGRSGSMIQPLAEERPSRSKFRMPKVRDAVSTLTFKIESGLGGPPFSPCRC
jgi:hypothetical protein